MKGDVHVHNLKVSLKEMPNLNERFIQKREHLKLVDSYFPVEKISPLYYKLNYKDYNLFQN